MKSFFSFAAAVAFGCLVQIYAAAEPKVGAVSTVPHELDWLVQSGHIQGACCSEQGIYLSHSLGLDKIGWDGKLLKHIEAPGHLGDCAYANGRIYGAFLIWDAKLRKGGKKGLVRVWDENLEQVDEAWFDEALDGIAVLGDTIYVGVDRWGNKPHRLCCVKRLGLDLSDKGNVDVDLGYGIVYGVQTMATDGKSLFFSNYAVGPKDGNPERFNTTRLTPELEVVENLKFRCTQGFGLVPKTVSRRDAPVFFKVCAMGGDMHGWRKDPENNPPRIRIEFYEWKNGQFTSVTKEDDPADLGDFVWANDDPEKYVVRNVPIKDMKPGMCAEVTMWVDASGLSEGGVPVTSYRADGLIVATPTGSTAYSMSAGGSIVDPRVSCFCVTPISPHSLAARPMIFPDSATLEIKNICQREKMLYLTVDGRTNYEMYKGDVVRIGKSPLKTNLVRIKKCGFYKKLRQKMTESE